MTKKLVVILFVLIIIVCTIFIIYKEQNKNVNNITENSQVYESSKSNKTENNHVNENSTINKTENKTDEIVIKNPEYIQIRDIDGNGKNYTFEYKNETYKVTYTKDNWHIVDSCKIRDKNDIAKICQALIEIHPIHGKDKVSYRTVEDMVYEWEQHNLAYDILPDGNSWKNKAKDVDLDPDDQGKSLQDMLKSRMK